MTRRYFAVLGERMPEKEMMLLMDVSAGNQVGR
jgi:hypothetical protein